MRINEFQIGDVLSEYVPFKPLVDSSDLLAHAIIFLLLGFVVVISFVAYEVINKTNKSRSLVTEFSIAGTASVLLGVGALFAMLAAGLYV